MHESVYVGIDVSKAWLDMACWGEEEVIRVRNDAAGDSGTLVKELVRRGSEFGRHGSEWWHGNGSWLQSWRVAQLPAVVVNPTRVRQFARATGQYAKTDAIDALMIARFAEAVRPEVRTLKDEDERELVRAWSLDVGSW